MESERIGRAPGVLLDIVLGAAMPAGPRASPPKVEALAAAEAAFDEAEGRIAREGVA